MDCIYMVLFLHVPTFPKNTSTCRQETTGDVFCLLSDVARYTPCVPDTLKSKDTINSLSMRLRDTLHFSPSETMHCEQQLVLKITVTSTRNRAARRRGKRCFNPFAHLLNRDETPSAQSHDVPVEPLPQHLASCHGFHFNN